jgi:hypothetical protein
MLVTSALITKTVCYFLLKSSILTRRRSYELLGEDRAHVQHLSILRFLCAVWIWKYGYRAVCCMFSPCMLFKSENSIQIKSICKISMLFLDLIACSFQWCTCFWCKSKNMYRKMDTSIHRNSSCIQPPFSAVRNQLAGKQSAAFKRVLNSGLGTTLRFYIYSVFVRNFCICF